MSIEAARTDRYCSPVPTCPVPDVESTLPQSLLSTSHKAESFWKPPLRSWLTVLLVSQSLRNTAALSFCQDAIRIAFTRTCPEQPRSQAQSLTIQTKKMILSLRITHGLSLSMRPDMYMYTIIPKSVADLLRDNICSQRLFATHLPSYNSSKTWIYFLSSFFSFSVAGGKS